MVEKQNISKILLSGFMGCGKTTLGRRVAKTSESWEFEDLDESIFKNIAAPKGHNSLGDYIRSVGWPTFRLNEHCEINRILQEDKNKIISLGGGSLSDENLEFLLKNPGVSIVWLDTPFEDCWSRIEGDSNRPLVQKGKSEANELYNKRLVNYRKSHYLLDVMQQTSIGTVHDLLDFMRKIDESAQIKA